MKVKILSAAFFFFCLWAALMPACNAAEAESSILSVSGSGTVQSVPDQATIILGVVTRADTAGAAQQENAAIAAAVQDVLAAIGIEEKDIRTEDYNFRPEYSREKNERSVIVGYTASNNIRVRVRDVAMTGEVIDAALENGANEVRSLDFSVSNSEGLRKKALESAVKDARSKADIIAGALGTRIIGIRQVTENTGMFQARSTNMSMMMRKADYAESTPIQPGEMSLTADVHIDFILAR